MPSVESAGADIPYERLSGPATLIFSDDAERRANLVELVTARGARVVEAATIAEAPARLERQAGAAAVVIDFVDDGGAPLDRVLDALDHAVAAALVEGLVIAPLDLIDPVTARLRQTEIGLLIDAGKPEIGRAFDSLLAPRPAVLAEGSADASSRRLAELSEEAGRIARALAALSGLAEAPPPAERPVDRAATLTLVRTMLRLRRLRDQYFDRALFADPAWDMLLDLFSARLERRSVAVSSLCIAAAVPPTTALRWIAAMTDRGLLGRRPDPDDGRRVFIELTDAAAEAIERYLGAAARLIPEAVAAARGERP